jgi:hypothetical protein
VHQICSREAWVIGCRLLLETRLPKVGNNHYFHPKPHIQPSIAFLAIAISFPSSSSSHILIQLAKALYVSVPTYLAAASSSHHLCLYTNQTMDSMLNQPSPAAAIGNTTKASPARSANNTNVTKRQASMPLVSSLFVLSNTQ